MTKYVSDLRLYQGSHFEWPRTHIPELTAPGLPSIGPHVHLYPSATFVWLAPIYATATLPAASSFELVVQATENPVREYFAMNARGEYCYLVPRTDGGVKVYDLALYRTTVPCTDGNSPLGFDGCSVDLETEPWLDGYVEEVDSDVEEEEEGEYEYLYLVWRTHPV